MFIAKSAKETKHNFNPLAEKNIFYLKANARKRMDLVMVSSFGLSLKKLEFQRLTSFQKSLSMTFENYQKLEEA